MLTVFLLVTVVFWLSRLTGDPVMLLSGFDATEESRENLRRGLGLDRPMIVQYVSFLGDVARLDFGVSYRTNKSAMSEVAARMPATSVLAATSLALAILVSLPLGIVAALWRGRFPDSVARFTALIGQAVPNFWLGLMLIYVIAVNVKVFPTGGRGGFFALVLPSITLATASIASLTRLTRSSMVDVMNQDFVVFARLKGVSSLRVVLRHGLANALIPILTIIGLQIGLLLAGSVVVETIFSWPGVGRLMIQAIEVSDFPIIQTVVFFVGTTVVLANLLTDLVYMFVDPRVRFE